MDEFIKLFGVMMAVMIPVAIGGGVFVLIAGRVKRFRIPRPATSRADLEQLERRLDELEQNQRQVHELAERLDFVERMLPALREGK
jgi:hypothetical protein